jgi:adenylosuccinate synthase
MLMMVKGFRHKFAGKHRESSCVLGRRRRLAFHDFTVVGETSRVQGEGVMVVRAMEMS